MIRIDGLTVLLGENGTGSSTVLKALYAVAEAPTGFSDKKERAISDAIDDLLGDSHVRMSDVQRDRVWRSVHERLHSGGQGASLSELTEILIDSGISAQNVQDIIRATQDILEGKADGELIRMSAKRNLEAEFSSIRQVRDLRSDTAAEIAISADGFRYGVSIDS